MMLETDLRLNDEEGLGTEADSQSRRPHIVTIYLSDDGADACRNMLTHWDDTDPPISFLVLATKQDQIDYLKSHLTESAHTTVEVTRKTKIEPGSVYLVRAESAAQYQDNYLVFSDQAEQDPAPEETFLSSLASSLGDRAIVLFSTPWIESSLQSIKFLRQHNAFVLHQHSSLDLDTLAAPLLPLLHLLDGSMPLEGTSDVIRTYINSFTSNELAILADEPDFNDQLNRLCLKLTELTRIPCSHVDLNRVSQHSLQRLRFFGITSLSDYIDYLERNPAEAVLLVKRITLRETSIFQDTHSLLYLSTSIIPSLIEEGEKKKTIKVWIPSCSTGEDALSVSLLFHDFFSRLEVAPHLQFIATEKDPDALKFARKPVYAKQSLRMLSDEWREQYFWAAGEFYQCAHEVLDQIHHSESAITDRLPYDDIDLIYCPGLISMLTNEAKDLVLNCFNDALSPEGILLISQEDELNADMPLFTAVDEGRLAYKPVQASTSSRERTHDIHLFRRQDNATTSPVDSNYERIKPDKERRLMDPPHSDEPDHHVHEAHAEIPAENVNLSDGTEPSPSVEIYTSDALESSTESAKPEATEDEKPVEEIRSIPSKRGDTETETDISEEQAHAGESNGQIGPSEIKKVHLDLIFQSHAPASVLILPDFSIVDQIGHLDRFISWPNNGSTANLLGSFPGEVREDLRLAVEQSIESGRTLISGLVKPEFNGILKPFRVQVRPIDVIGDIPVVHIVFLPPGNFEEWEVETNPADIESEKDNTILQLQEELGRAKEQLQHTSELLKSARGQLSNTKTASAPAVHESPQDIEQSGRLARENEDLKSSNRELLALNRGLVKRVEELRKNMQLQLEEAREETKKEAAASQATQRSSPVPTPPSPASTSTTVEVSGDLEVIVSLILQKRQEIRMSLTSMISFADMLTKRMVDNDNRELTAHISKSGNLISKYLTPLLESEIEMDEDSAPAYPDYEEESTQSSNSPERVLVVDDSEATRRLLAHVLSGRFDCVVAASGSEAVEKAEKEVFRAVLLDINLGEGPSGVDVLEHLRKKEHYEDVPFMAITSISSPHERTLLLNKGFDAFLPKPFQKAQLLNTLDQMIEEKSIA